MMDLANEVILEINTFGIGGLMFKPIPVACDMEQLDTHKISCIVKQNDREIMSLLVPGIISSIKLQEQDYNVYNAYRSLFLNKVQEYRSGFAMIDMTGRTDIDVIYDMQPNLDDHYCTCEDTGHPEDHIHDIMKVGVSTDKYLHQASAWGQYKNHRTVNNDESAIRFRGHHYGRDFYIGGNHIYTGLSEKRRFHTGPWDLY